MYTTATGTNPDFGFNLGTLGTVVDTVNLSAFKAATAANGVTVALNGAAVNGATVTGSANHDSITGSNQADTIITGANGGDITAGGGVDTITLTASVAKTDLITWAAAADSSNAAYDTITGFTNSATATVADKLDFLGTGVVKADTAAGTATGVTNLTAAVTNGFITFAGTVAPTATLANHILAAQTLSNAVALNTVAWIEGGNTYVYNSGAATATTPGTFINSLE